MVYSVTPPYCLYIALIATEYLNLISVRISMSTGTLRGNHPIRAGYKRAVTIDGRTRNRNLAWQV